MSEKEPILELNEGISRPRILRGYTYKVKAPVQSQAIYITINDILVGEGDGSKYRPFEIFINSSNMENFQWVVALTRVMSAVFRKGGNIDFLVEELNSVFNPEGGYYKPGSKGKYINSVVNEIALVLEEHLKTHCS